MGNGQPAGRSARQRRLTTEIRMLLKWINEKWKDICYGMLTIGLMAWEVTVLECTVQNVHSLSPCVFSLDLSQWSFQIQMFRVAQQIWRWSCDGKLVGGVQDLEQIMSMDNKKEAELNTVRLEYFKLKNKMKKAEKKLKAKVLPSSYFSLFSLQWLCVCVCMCALSLCLSVCLSLSLSLCLSVSLSLVLSTVPLSLTPLLSLSLSLSLSLAFVVLSVSLCLCHYHCVSLSLSLYLSPSLSVSFSHSYTLSFCLSVSLSLCLCLSVWPPHWPSG